MKVCNKCKLHRPEDEFYSDISRGDKLSNICKKCSNERNLEYRRTMTGLIYQIYSSQKTHSIQRNHPLPTYTKYELQDWMYKQPLFNKLYADWVVSNYDKNLTPSVDRKDDYKGYSLDNIQLTIWDKNNKKGSLDQRNGINTKQCRAVDKYDLNNNFIESYYSISKASRDTGLSISCIYSACNGIVKKPKFFNWKYKQKEEL